MVECVYNNIVPFHIHYYNINMHKNHFLGWGVLRFGLDGGVPLEPQNTFPFLRVIFAEKVTYFQAFFSKYRPMFHIFWVFATF